MSKNLTILVADYDSKDLFLLSRAFKKTGLKHFVATVKNGQEAIDYLSGNPPFNDRTQAPLPNLVLLDLKMPKASGFDVLTWLQTQKPLRHVPVIAFSSSAV